MKDMAIIGKIKFPNALKAVCITHLATLTGKEVLPAQDPFYLVQRDDTYKVLALATGLLTTDLKIIEIAFEVGFRNYRCFSRLFTCNVGMSPSAFRKCWKG